MGRADLKAKIRLEGDASGATKAIKKTERSFKGLASKLKAGAFAIAGALASVVGALKLIESAGERLGQQRALERTLTAQGIAVDEFVGKLRGLSNQQIATSDLILSSNRALALGISADDIPGLLEAATKASVSLGISATQAFNDITTGVGRASPLILDNLGIVVDAVKVYAAYAAEIGVATEALTKQQKTAALSAAVMENAAKGAADFADAQSAVTVALGRSKTALKEWFEQTVDSAAQSSLLADVINGLTEGTKNYAAAIRALKTDLDALSASDKELVESTQVSRKEFDLLLGMLPFLHRAFQELGSVQRLVEDAQADLAENTAKITARYEENNRAMLNAIGFLDSYSDAQEKAADRTKRIETELAAEASSLSKLAAALGEVTQIELEKEFLDISKALDEARNSTDANSDAFVRYEQIATERMGFLQTNIQRLRDGLDVLAESTDDAGGAIAALGGKSDEAGSAVDDLTGSIDDADGGMAGLSASVRDTSSALSAQASQARATASELTQLTAVAESLALAEARTQLALTQQARKRITGTQGSRDQNVGRFTGRFVGPVGTYTLNPDGTLTPA